MKAVIEPGSISGSLAAPPSKSMTQRAYAAALLHKGKTVVHNAGHSEDEDAALGIIQQLGAEVTSFDSVTEITSDGVYPTGGSINCGESGLSVRLFTPIAALSDKAIMIDGTGSLLQRPMAGFREVLSALSVSIGDFNGYVPLTVQGPMQAKPVHVNAEDGSQFLSGLLFALSSCATEPVTIAVTGLKSKPYIDLTLEVLAHFGKPIRHKEYKEFFVDPNLFTQQETIEINIEADWSSAAYLLVAGAVAGEICISNLRPDSKQADVAILDVLRNAGAAVIINGDSITVKKSQMQAFEFDATDCPDLFPVLSILAACCDGESYIGGVHRLFHKESNRAESITEMLGNFDVPFSIEDDTLCITGVKKLQGTVIDPHHDHRIVMAAAIGALRANGRVDILHSESVNKSYPGFFRDLILCGGRYTEI